MTFSPNRSTIRSTLRLAAACALVVVGAVNEVHAQQGQVPIGEVLQKVGFDQKLDEQLPLDLTFKDETGASVGLDTYFGPQRKKPVVLQFVYYECPMLCTQVLNGFASTLKILGLEPGDDFEIVTVSINHRESPGLALQKKTNYLELVGRPQVGKGWHFLTGDQASITKLSDAAGFRFMWDPEIEQYAHAGGLVVVTPEGRISRYFFGIEFDAKNLRFALMEASKEGIGSLADRVVLTLCYMYDPITGKYGFAIINVIRLLCGLSVVALGSFMFVTLRRDRRLARAATVS